MPQQLLPPISAAKRLAEVEQLYRDGLYLQAYAKAQAIGPLREWTGPEGRVLAGRLAGVLGGGRLSRALHLTGFRENPDEPLACYYGVRAVFARRGPWNARREWHRIGPLAGAPNYLRADWHSLYALISATLRDFEVADQFIDEALALAPARPWIHVERSSVLQIEDRFDEAIASAERSLELRPWFRPGVQASAEYLCRLNRDREAIDLLTAAAERLECGNIVAQLAVLLSELERDDEAREHLARVGELFPLQDKGMTAWLAGVECDVNSRCGDLAKAIAAGRRADSKYYKSIVASLEVAGPTDRRVVLPVEFVQQQHVTCAPATLTAVSKYWRHDKSQIDIADQICYDGTPQHLQRRWAEANGFVVRQFSVDWDTTVALIDRGVPFTMVTVHPPNSHLVAVVGYDSRRRTLVLRDPSLRCHSDLLAKEGLEAYRSTGPLGMVMAPAAESHRLDGVELPDAALYDDLHELLAAIERHDRQRASTALARMRERDPDHRLTLYARRALAGYDCDPIATRHAYEQMLKQFPDDTMLLLARIASMRTDTSRQERIDFLREIDSGARAHPLFRLQLVEELGPDARCHAEVGRLLRRLLIQQPYEARCYYAQARVEWSDRRFGEATELYRCAACLNDKNDAFARDWFLAARHAKRGEQALAFLRARFERYGSKSNRPAITLSNAYSDLNLGRESWNVLDEALRRRPDDGELLVFAADACYRRGDFAGARRLLADAEGRSHRGAWLRTTAALSTAEGELAQARVHWAKVLELEPHAEDAHRATFDLIEATEGQLAAFDHLRQAVAQFPNNLALLRLTIGQFSEQLADESEAMIRRLLEINPTDAWAHRELALLLSRKGQFDEAVLEAETAIALSPGESIGYAMRGFVRERAGEIPRAMADYRLAIEHSADDEQSIKRLLYCAPTHADRVAALKFVHEQLKHQTTFGTGILTYREQAQRILKPDDVLAHLRDAFAARPDLWHAWSALIRQLTDMDRLDEAKDLAIQATERFPLLPGGWRDLAAARRACRDAEGEIAALDSAFQINPNWNSAICALADALSRNGQSDRERSVLEKAVARLPLDGVIRCYLSDALWQAGDREGCLGALEIATCNMPNNDKAWNTLTERARIMQCPERAERAVRDLVARYPGDAGSWFRLAQILRSPDAFAERMAALDRAVELNPRSTTAHVLRAELLREAKRFTEARAACVPANYGERPPAELRLEAARVSAAENDLESAIAEAREIVEENPDFYNGWRQLCEWYSPNPASASELLEAGKRIVELYPKDTVGWRYVGDAQMRLNKRDEAKNAYRRSIELNEEWLYPRQLLFDLCFEDKECDAAAEAIRKPLAGNHDAYTLARQIQLVCWRRKRDEATATLEDLCKQELPTEWPLATAVAAMSGRGWREPARLALRAAMVKAGANPQLAVEWAKLEVKQKQFRRATGHLEQLAGNETAWAAAARTLLSGLADAKKRISMAWFIRRHAARLRRDDITWGSVGYSLVTIGKYRAVAKWLSDWKSRRSAQPWMLLNLALALAVLNRDEEAAVVHRHALTLPRDQTASTHQIYLAALDVAAGRFEEAKRLMDQTAGLQLRDYVRCVRTVVDESLRVRDDPALAARWFPSIAANRRLTKAMRPFAAMRASHRHLRRTYSRVVGRLARDRRWWLLRFLSA